MVQRGELARHVIRLVEARRGGADQADALRHRGQRGQQRDGLELRLVAVRGTAEELDIVAARAYAVGQEDQVELRRLGGLGQRDIVLDVDARVGLGIGMAPGRDMVAAGIKEGAQAEETATLSHDCLSIAYRLMRDIRRLCVCFAGLVAVPAPGARAACCLRTACGTCRAAAGSAPRRRQSPAARRAAHRASG